LLIIVYDHIESQQLALWR